MRETKQKMGNCAQRKIIRQNVKKTALRIYRKLWTGRKEHRKEIEQIRCEIVKKGKIILRRKLNDCKVLDGGREVKKYTNEISEALDKNVRNTDKNI